MVENKTIGELMYESQEYMKKTGEILESIHRKSQEEGYVSLEGQDIPEMRELLVLYGQYRQLHMVLAEAVRLYEELHPEEDNDEVQEAVMVDEQQFQDDKWQELNDEDKKEKKEKKKKDKKDKKKDKKKKKTKKK